MEKIGFWYCFLAFEQTKGSPTQVSRALFSIKLRLVCNFPLHRQQPQLCCTSLSLCSVRSVLPPCSVAWNAPPSKKLDTGSARLTNVRTHNPLLPLLRIRKQLVHPRHPASSCPQQQGDVALLFQHELKQNSMIFLKTSFSYSSGRE